MTRLNPGENANGRILQRKFTDIDEVAEVLNAISQRQLRFDQLSLQRFQSNILLAEFDQAQFVFADASCPIHCSGEKMAGYVRFRALIIVSAIQAKRPPPQASVILVGEGFQTLGSSELP